LLLFRQQEEGGGKILGKSSSLSRSFLRWGKKGGNYPYLKGRGLRRVLLPLSVGGEENFRCGEKKRGHPSAGKGEKKRKPLWPG